MSQTSADIAATWTYATADIPARGIDTTRTATAAEREALAAKLEILGLERLVVRYRITPLANGRFRLSGTVDARVVQACVVTLDPVETTLEEAMDVEFHPSEAPAGSAAPSDEEMSALEAEEHEPIEHGRLEVGRIVTETVGASLPAYPRAPDAALEQHEAGPGDTGSTGPFASLANWKPKPE